MRNLSTERPRGVIGCASHLTKDKDTVMTIDGQKRLVRSYVEQENAYFSVLWRFLVVRTRYVRRFVRASSVGGAVLPIYGYDIFTNVSYPIADFRILCMSDM